MLQFGKITQSKVELSQKAREREAQEELHNRIFTCVNNGGHADAVVTDPNFREIIDFAIKRASDLKNYEHLGLRKYVGLQCLNFKQFIDSVTDLIDECRQWFIKHTVSI